MPGTTIGEVNINLRMNLVQFNKDVKDGTDAAGKATQDFSKTVGVNMTEARGSLSLIGEEFGVKIPRHLQKFIAGLPGVGAALDAAFTSVAIIALIELIVKVGEKIVELQKHAEDVKDKLEATGILGADSMRKIQEETLQLDAQIEILSQNYLAALSDQIKLIDSQTLTHITDEFRTMSADVLKDIDAMKVGWAEALVGLGNDREIQGIQKDIKETVSRVNELNKAGDNTEIGAVLGAALERVNVQLHGSASLAKNVVEALSVEKTFLEDQVTKYGLINAAGEKKKKLAEDTAAIQQRQADLAFVADRTKETQEIQKLSEETNKLGGVQQTEASKTITAIDALIQKWRDHDASVQAQYPGIKTFFDAYISKLETAKALLVEHNAAQQKLFQSGIIPGVEAKPPAISFDEGSAGFAGTSDQLTLEKIKTNSNAAKELAQQERDGAETVNEKYREQVLILNELRDKGLLVGADYEQAMAKATAAADKGNHAWAQFGTQVGNNILAAAEMKESWGQALASILEDLLKVILQMEVMKALSSFSGGGGIFGSIVGSLFGGHKATGGPVYQDQSYLVGENGPELFTPGASGRITPNGSTGGQTNITYQIDARGAQAGVSNEIREALAQTENRAVARAVVTSREIQLRRAS